MSTLKRFDEVLDAIDKLPPEDQDKLIAIVERRQLAQRRTVLAQEIQDARQEFQSGACQPRSAADLIKEIRS